MTMPPWLVWPATGWGWIAWASASAVVATGLSRLLTLAITLRGSALVPRLSRALSKLVRAHAYSPAALLDADGAGAALVARRRRGLDALAETLGSHGDTATAAAASLRAHFSDLRFTDASRVPFPFVAAMRARFDLTSVVTKSRGPYLQHADGRWTLDVSGSYGLNVAGFDRYKVWIERGWARVRDLGPVLGPVHPIVADNVERLSRLSGLDEVSFHMSGTEAVMAAVRLARFNTRRRLVVCFSGAYHGWWDGVQPGLGSERAIDDCLVLKDLSPASLAVIRRRRREIAAVLVNPIQAFHPNSPPPNDAILLTSDVRRAEASSRRYGRWLGELAETCRTNDVPLVLDEVYTGFRLAPGGAQEFFGVRADLVVYGKTVAGGLPIGVVCGRARLMRRVDPDRPMRMAYVVGTFAAHPAVMGAMNEFLRWVETPAAADEYADANAACDLWAHGINREFAERALPVRVVNLGTVWTVLFKEPSRFNWLLQYYLRVQGVTLSWVGTGRCLTSFDFTPGDYAALQTKLVNAALTMKRDGWWPTAAEFPRKDQLMRKRLFREAIASVATSPASLRSFYEQVMKRKDDDHHASHNDPANQLLHLVSSSAFIVCYAILALKITPAMFIGMGALFLRQIGHAVLEPACHDEEKLLLGYNTRNKTIILATYFAIPLIVLALNHAWSWQGIVENSDLIAMQWFRWTLLVVLGRVAFLTFTHGFRLAMVWFVKLVTDPFTDVVTYFPRRPQRA